MSPVEPIRGQSFSMAEHAEARALFAPFARLGFRLEVAIEHEAYPETLEVYLPRSDEFDWMIVKDLEGRIVVDDFGTGGSQRFANMADAFAPIAETLAREAVG